MHCVISSQLIAADRPGGLAGGSCAAAASENGGVQTEGAMQGVKEAVPVPRAAVGSSHRSRAAISRMNSGNDFAPRIAAFN